MLAFQGVARQVLPHVSPSARDVIIPRSLGHSRRWLHDSIRQKPNRSTRKRIRWMTTFAGVTVGVVSYQAYSKYNSAEFATVLESEGIRWEGKIIASLPAKRLSSWIGKFLAESRIPVSLRKPFFLTYAFLFNANVDEVEMNDLTDFRTFGEWFTRRLKPGARKIDAEADLVMPCDGHLLDFGTVQADGRIRQVKNASYQVSTLLHGSPSAEGSETPSVSRSADIPERLHYAVIYLHPGDYHRFHSPTEWLVSERRHINGELLSVSSVALKLVPTLLGINERVSMLGRWKHGLFAMVAVGAFNVGDIRLDFDDELRTNTDFSWTRSVKTRRFMKEIERSRGQDVGHFQCGSCIILLFEGKDAVQWYPEIGPVRLGQRLCKFKQL